MAKISIIFMLLSLSTLISNSECLSQESKTINPKPFRVYLAEIGSGANETSYEVARAPISTTPTSFGIVYVGDNILLAGPDLNSQRLGRSQGTAVTAGLFEPVSVPNLNFIFEAGKYKGSSLRIAGRRLIFVPNQEIPIVGGTGFFREARGYAISSLVSFNPIGNVYIFEYILNVQF